MEQLPDPALKETLKWRSLARFASEHVPEALMGHIVWCCREALAKDPSDDPLMQALMDTVERATLGQATVEDLMQALTASQHSPRADQHAARACLWAAAMASSYLQADCGLTIHDAADRAALQACQALQEAGAPVEKTRRAQVRDLLIRSQEANS